MFRNETRPGLLPNEVSTINTVWALFVRAFPDTLSMHWFETSKWTIYFLDQLSGVYRVLQDLRLHTSVIRRNIFFNFSLTLSFICASGIYCELSIREWTIFGDMLP